MPITLFIILGTMAFLSVSVICVTLFLVLKQIKEVALIQARAKVAKDAAEYVQITQAEAQIEATKDTTKDPEPDPAKPRWVTDVNGNVYDASKLQLLGPGDTFGDDEYFALIDDVDRRSKETAWSRSTRPD